MRTFTPSALRLLAADITRRAPTGLAALTLGTACLVAFLPLPAQASYLADSGVSANDSSRRHDIWQGVTIESYNGPITSGGGSVGTGGTVSTSFVADTDSWLGIPYSGYAYGSANLNSGSLHAVANSTFGNPSTGGFAQVQVRWVDGITFTTAGAGPGTTTSFVVDLKLTGTLSQELNFNQNYYFSIYGVGGGGGTISRSAIFDSEPGPSYYDYLGPVDAVGFDSWQVLSNTVGNMHFRGVVSYTGASKTFGLDTSLGLRCTSGTSCDFGNSARLSFEMPADVSFTSSSGVLLTAAVPEPGTVGMLALGLAVVGWACRRRSVRQ